MKKLINFFEDEEGAAMPEYGLLVALIAIVAIAGVTIVGTSLLSKFTTVGNTINAAGGTTATP